MLYVRSIASLLDWFRSHAAEQQGRGAWQAAPPLVINTHGWIKVGLWLLTSDCAFAIAAELLLDAIEESALPNGYCTASMRFVRDCG